METGYADRRREHVHRLDRDFCSVYKPLLPVQVAIFDVQYAPTPQCIVEMQDAFRPKGAETGDSETGDWLRTLDMCLAWS